MRCWRVAAIFCSIGDSAAGEACSTASGVAARPWVAVFDAERASAPVAPSCLKNDRLEPSLQFMNASPCECAVRGTFATRRVGYAPEGASVGNGIGDVKKGRDQ